MNTTVLSASLAVWLMTPAAPMPAAEGVGQDRAESDSIERMSRYNVVWTSPSKDATGVMPIGNGDIAAGVYAIENGDLFLLLSKNDAFNYRGDLKFYQVEPMAARFPDPFRFNTFGNLLESPQMTLKEGVLCGTGTSFDLRIHALAMQTPSPETWIEAIERQALPPADAARDWAEHRAWHGAYRNRQRRPADRVGHCPGLAET
jgi:hypothetical protein